MKRLLFVCMAFGFAWSSPSQTVEKRTTPNPNIAVGAARMDQYLPLLRGKKIGIICNQTSRVGKRHLVDTLLAEEIDILRIFAPEHGFRGEASAGAVVQNSEDPITHLPILSLYGKNKKPKADMVQDLDLLVFDIQDVGARFYTYISTMHYAMEAAAENGVSFLVLDRPNPHGFYVDGPVLDPKYASFVGMHPIPVVHGLTVGELAQMINGEGWLKDGIQVDLEVIPCENYHHLDLYELPVAPSPNLPNMAAIYLYPSLCLFEGTQVSVGRGTDSPFQIIGYPNNSHGNMGFTPRPIPGVAEHPKYEGRMCTGHNLSEFATLYFPTAGILYLDWLIGMYENYPEKDKFFTSNHFIDKLAGSPLLRQQICEGKSEEEIRRSWIDGLGKYKKMRKKYLLYEDFE